MSPRADVILLLLLLSGILSGIAGAWWTSGQLWIWAAIGVLVPCSC